MMTGLEASLRAVGALLLKWRSEGPIQGKWEGAQFKAMADAWAHRELAGALQKIAPGIPVISEEDEKAVPESGATYWLIDPIDGTASFAGGYDGFVTQAGLIREGRVELAAVYAPALERMYTAQKGQGAMLNGNRLQAPNGDVLGTLVDNYPKPTGAAQAAYRDLGFDRYLESGSIGLKICLVADGSADLFFKDVVVRDWDVAAPGLVLEESGGVLSGIEGEAIEISGRGRHYGLVAARSSQSCRKVVGWYRDKWKGSAHS